MMLPDKALLESRIRADDDLEGELCITAHHDCRGLLGEFYRYVMLPLHEQMFEMLLNMIEGECEHAASSARDLPAEGLVCHRKSACLPTDTLASPRTRVGLSEPWGFRRTDEIGKLKAQDRHWVGPLLM